MEQLWEAPPSEPVLLTLDRFPSDGMLFRLHKQRNGLFSLFSKCLSYVEVHHF